jgi:hypothetical protein
LQLLIVEELVGRELTDDLAFVHDIGARGSQLQPTENLRWPFCPRHGRPPSFAYVTSHMLSNMVSPWKRPPQIDGIARELAAQLNLEEELVPVNAGAAVLDQAKRRVLRK